MFYLLNHSTDFAEMLPGEFNFMFLKFGLLFKNSLVEPAK
jgi:hypothetical protein